MLDGYQKKFLEDLKKSDTLILVEGKRDRKALEAAGLNKIIEISGKTLEKVVDILKEKQSGVIILTDYDKEGIKQFKRLKSLSLSNEIKVYDDMRKKFKRIFRVNKIEELSSYFK